jgi:muconolactone delta-isomerase
VTVDFLVEFEIEVPAGASATDVTDRERAEAVAADKLVDAGHLLRVWRRSLPSGATSVLGLYRADSPTELDGLLEALPMHDWMTVTVTPLGPHPNDPANGRHVGLPAPRLTPVYRLEATVGEPLDLSDTIEGRRRIVPLTGGTFTGPRLSGALVSGASADWQTVFPDGTALGDVRYTLRTDEGELLSVHSRGVRHGPAEVLARLARGEAVDAGEYTFRASTQIETAAPRLRGSTGSTRACSSPSPPGLRRA